MNNLYELSRGLKRHRKRLVMSAIMMTALHNKTGEDSSVYIDELG